MQIASILSDLTSLRVCVSSEDLTYECLWKLKRNLQDHDAALALVSVYKTDASFTGDPNVNSLSDTKVQEDPDMQRALDLVRLHYDVKINHIQAKDTGLQQARRDVDNILKTLKRRRDNVAKE